MKVSSLGAVLAFSWGVAACNANIGKGPDAAASAEEGEADPAAETPAEGPAPETKDEAGGKTKKPPLPKPPATSTSTGTKTTVDGGEGSDEGSDDMGSTDHTAPVATISTPAALRLTDVVAGKIVIKGTVSDDDTGVQAAQVSLKKSGGACLNAGKTAFDAACPAPLPATEASGAFEFAVPAALLSHEASYEITVDATDGNANTGHQTASFTWSRKLELYIGIQNSGAGGSFLQKLEYVVGADAAEDVSSGNVTVPSSPAGGQVMIGPHVANQALRSLALKPDGTLVAGSTAANLSAAVDADDTVTAGPVMGAPALGHFHGLCFLPNGHFIAGYYNSYTADTVREYAADGSYVRDVYTTTVNSLTDCVAKSNDEIYLVDYDADNDNAGAIVHRVLDGGVWQAAAAPSFAASTLAANSSIYSLILHSDGNVYAAPQHQGGARNVKVIRCDEGDLAQCAAVGSNVMASGEGFMQGLAEIPGVGDLLLVSSTHLYRYDRTAGTATSIFDVTTLPNVDQVRHLRIR